MSSKNMNLFLSTYYSRRNSDDDDCFKVVILNRSILQSKIIANQLKAALMPYTNNFKIQLACNGGHKNFYHERVLTCQGVNIIIVDNAIACEVEVIDLLHRLRDESSNAIIIGLTSSLTSSYDKLKNNGCDFIWQRPIPKQDLNTGLNTIFNKNIHMDSLHDCIN